MMNNKKTEYIAFAPSKKARTPSYINVTGVNIGDKEHKEKIKRILSRMACSIKIL